MVLEELTALSMPNNNQETVRRMLPPVNDNQALLNNQTNNNVSVTSKATASMGCCHCRCGSVCFERSLLVCGIFFLAFGAFAAFLYENIYTSILHKQFSLSNTKTKGYENWKETPIPMYLSFYLFNWTNSDQVVKDQLNPKFNQLGPYVFYEHHIRENVTYNDNNTLTYYNKRTWRFEPSLSNGSLQDRVTVVNPVALIVGDFVKSEHYLVRRAVNFFFEEENVGLTVTKTVDEMLFKGYDDPLLDIAIKLNMTKLKIPFKTFGWFVDRNNSVTFDGRFNMYTGADEWSREGIIYAWNYEHQTSYYPGPCGIVNGTSGELWYPTHDDEEIYLFAPDLCSSINMHKNGTMEKHGVTGTLYVSKEDILDNGTYYKEKSCFARDGIHNGVRGVSTCKFNAPAFMSLPHFYMADPFYRSKVDGMKPDPQKHTAYLALEPNTGLPLEVNAAFQLNLLMSNIPGINIFSKVKDTMMPCFWFAQTAELTPELATLAKVVLDFRKYPVYVGYGLLVLAVLLFGWYAYLRFQKRKSTDQEVLITDSSTHSEGLDNSVPS